jgi:hypothetical protein
MQFIKHFFAFISAFLAGGSMALTLQEINVGKVYMVPQGHLNPVISMVHVLLVIL